jgi:hypothetical protein
MTSTSTKGYDWITQEMFDKKLEELLDKETGNTLLSIPGVAEILIEHFNNDVLEALTNELDEATLDYEAAELDDATGALGYVVNRKEIP